MENLDEADRLAHEIVVIEPAVPEVVRRLDEVFLSLAGHAADAETETQTPAQRS